MPGGIGLGGLLRGRGDGEMKADAATNGRFRPIERVSQCPNPLGQASWDARFSPLAPDGVMV
jgi:hypothetical protein